MRLSPLVLTLLATVTLHSATVGESAHAPPSSKMTESCPGIWRILLDGSPDAYLTATLVPGGTAVGAFREQQLSWTYDEGVFQLYLTWGNRKIDFLGRFEAPGVLQGRYEIHSSNRRGTWIAYRSQGLYDESPADLTGQNLVVLDGVIYRRAVIKGREVLVQVAVTHER